MPDITEADLRAYFESFQLPPGADWISYLARFDELMNRVRVPMPEPEIVTIRESDDWKLRIAIWKRTANQSDSSPVVLHLHGGQWTSGNHLSHRGLAAELAHRGYLVVSVDYRKAPSRRFPAAFDDCAFTLRWCAENIGRFGGDSKRIAVVGDSAGGNLAAAVLAYDFEGFARAGAYLFGIFHYGQAREALDLVPNGSNSYATAEMQSALEADARLSPILAANRLPLSYVAVGTLDPLLQQSRDLREALIRAERPFVYHELPGAPHSYVQLPNHPLYAEGLAGLSSFLQLALAVDGRSVPASLPPFPSRVELHAIA